MFRVIEAERENVSAVDKLRELIERSSVDIKTREWSFPQVPGKYDIKTLKINTPYGDLGVGLPEKPLDGRYLHLFTYSLDTSTLSPQVEINIPLVLDRNVSGVYVNNGRDTLLCSRGKFHHIKTNMVLSKFPEGVIEVQDGDKITSVIEITNLSSPILTDNIAKFLYRVNQLKREIKSQKVMRQKSIM